MEQQLLFVFQVVIYNLMEEVFEINVDNVITARCFYL